MTDKLWLYRFSIVLMEQVKSQISYCPLMWTFCSGTSMNKLSNNHKNCPRLITNDYDSHFNELLESSHELSIHKTCINYLMIEVYKYLHGRSPELMTDIFTLRKNPYNIRNIRLLYSDYIITIFAILRKSTVSAF